MSSPAIYSGTRSRLLTSLGLELSSGQTIDYSADPNLIKRPNDVSGWSTTGANGPTGANSTSSSDLPIEGIVNNCLKLTSSTSAGAEASHYFSYPITMPTAYLNRKHKIEFWMRPGSNFIASEWTVSIYASATRMTLATDSSGVTYLPNASGKFTTTFDADSSTSYTLRFSRPVNAGGNAAVLNLSGIVVGPGIQATSAVITSPISYTPSSSITNATVTEARYWRVGEFIDASVNITFSGAGTLAFTAAQLLPSGLTINDAQIVQLTADTYNEAVVGDYRAVNAAVLSYTGPLNYTLASTFEPGNATGDGAAFTPGASDGVSLNFRVPITEWAGSGTMNVIQDDTLTEWTSYTPTVTNLGAGSSTNTGFWRRVGDTAEIRCRILKDGTPGTGTSNVLVTIPTGLTYDTTKVTGAIYVGYGSFAGATFEDAIDIQMGSTNGMEIRDSGTAQNFRGDDFTAGGELNFDVRVPITQWRGRSGGGPVGFAMANTAGHAGLVNPYGGTGVVYASTYTPTLTGVANVAASTAYTARYMRVGSVVTVSGTIDVDPTSASTLTRLGISLPIASDFTGDNCAGTAVGAQTGTIPIAGRIGGDTTNNRAELNYICGTPVANENWTFTFTYSIL